MISLFINANDWNEVVRKSLPASLEVQFNYRNNNIISSLIGNEVKLVAKRRDHTEVPGAQFQVWSKEWMTFQFRLIQLLITAIGHLNQRRKLRNLVYLTLNYNLGLVHLPPVHLCKCEEGKKIKFQGKIFIKIMRDIF